MNADNPMIRALLAKARADDAVLAVLLFGSTARGDATNDSDVDVCLVLRPEGARTAHPAGRTDRAGEVRLEYLGLFDLDIHVFQQLPLHVRSRALKESRVLHVTDEDALYELAIRTAKAFEDFKPYRRRYLETVLRAGS